MKYPAWVVALACALGCVSGLVSGWWLYRPVVVIEAAAPAVRQADNSLIAERAPGELKPAQQIPSKTTPVRVAQVRIKPKVIAGSDENCGCEPIIVDSTLVRSGDGGQRLVVSAVGGDVLSAIDSPLDPLTLTRLTPWAAGGSYGTGGRVGAFIDRDLGPLRVGAEVDQASGADWQVHVKVGFRF